MPHTHKDKRNFSAALLLALVIGSTRVLQGVHYPTDVLAGWSIGLACAHLPLLSPLPAEDAHGIATRCRQAFPAQPWRATHTIFASLPFGQNGAVVGVTAVGSGGLHAVLLSPEGICLFDASQASGASDLIVHRAVPPFDRPGFATSLISDVGHAYLPPAGEPTAIGTYATGETVCRWSQAGETTDVVLRADGPRAVRTYREVRLTREIDLLGTAADGFFPAVHLLVPGISGYQLDMSLVDHE